ncbi:Regulatory protein LEU3 [Escovopsis weberi]|uniref:Regulatory protein LEU3 n=1 Tax=Escovopsis weberi TaxID=150374 RepID=A0A0M8MUF4_ESCWE|nr:Regulatory protein LEU3 [Escovopsis weberi]
MAPSPPLADTQIAVSASSHDERTRRNVACINCRNSKVRCKTSLVLGQPCQRCAKLELPCVVDKTHKRVTKRSKLELLEQEVRAIQQAVHQGTEPTTSSTDVSPLVAGPRPSGPASHPAALLEDPPTSLHAPIFPIHASPKTGPTEDRVLDERRISGEDIDYYFAMFFQHFYPFAPLLRKKIPDECFHAQPMLFWIVLYIACRRYSRDPGLVTVLYNHINKNIWAMLSIPALGLEEIHAILLACMWPFPTTRLATDPGSMLANIAMNAAMMLGLHTGRGSHPQFCLGLRNPLTSTDEEASATWAACCIVVQRNSTIAGHPPPSFQFSDLRCIKTLEACYWADLLTLYDLQKFLNRFHTAMFAQIAASNSIPEGIIRMWELELEVLKPTIVRYDTEISRIRVLSSMLEVQLYHFQGQSMTPPLDTNLQINILRAFNTARAVILNAVDLQARRQLLTHATNCVFRSIADAACLIIYLLHCAGAQPDIAPLELQMLGQQACAAVGLCSVSEEDVPYRMHSLMDMFWKHRDMLPMFQSLPPSWIERCGAGLMFACLERFKASLLTIQHNSESIKSTMKMINPSRVDLTAKGITTMPNEKPDPNGLLPDPFQDIDWNMLMDDLTKMGSEGVLFGII